VSTRAGNSALLILALLACAPAGAAELRGPEEGVVPYGMGRAYSAVAQDSLSLFYNPAGLAMVDRVDLQIFDLKLESNSDVLKSYGLLSKLKSSSSTMANTISQFAGKHIMADASNVTQLTIPYFSLGVVYDAHTDFDLENLAYPVTSMRYTRDLEIVGGVGIPLDKKKDFRVGASVKYMTRTGGDREIPISQISGSRESITSLFSQTATGVGGDFGLQYRLPVPGRIEYTSSFVWHDIGQTSFGGPAAKDPPTAIEQNMVAGFGIRFPIGGGQNRRAERRYGPKRSSSSLSLDFDYDHLETSTRREALVKHSHLGANLDLPLFSFQLGLNQTSLTFGTTFDIGILKVALASYAEELGSYAGQHEDRRYLVSVGSSFGFSRK
jgi:hypothetical protein